MKYVSVKWIDGIAVVRPKGSFGGLYGGEETDALDAVLTRLNRDGARRVIIDLGAINFMSSMPLGTLIRAHKRFVERGARIVLCHLLDRIHQIFIITKLSLVFDIFDNLHQAIETLSRWEDPEARANVEQEVVTASAGAPSPTDRDQAAG